MTTRNTGYLAECDVCVYLIKNGYKIIKQNYTIKGGEVDIIAQKGDIIVFVEVKARKKNALVTGYEAITKVKKERIMKTAQHYIIQSKCELQPRFDIAVIELKNGKTAYIDYIENAYDMSDTNIIF